jgi:hypothetical protein
MRKIWAFAIVIASALATAPLAKADTITYDISGALKGTFTVVTGTAINGGFDVVSGTLNIAGLGVFQLFANPSPGNALFSPTGAFIFDDLLFPASGNVLDVNGLLFTALGGTEWNIWGNGNGTYSLYEYIPGVGYQMADTVTLTAVPEPGSLLLFGSGLGFLALLLWRKVHRREQTTAQFRAAWS